MWTKLTKCKSCGAEIATSAKTCPQCGAKQHQVEEAICWVILAFACVFLFFISRGNSDKPKLVSSTPEESASVAPTEQPLVFGIGEVAELKDIQVSLTSVEESGGSKYLAPDAGNTFLICHFNIENNSQNDIGVSSLLSFNAYVDEYATNISLSAISASKDSQLNGSVAAGKKIAGVVGYEVPEDWSELEIRFKPDFWSGKDITFVASNADK